MSQKRSIFEEVGAEKREAAAAPQGGMIDARPKGARAALWIWLFVLFALVVAMISLGGATRLSDAGLSITEWKPVTGALPPMSQEAWVSEFQKYQEIPQFKLQNPDMTLQQFEGIYWWEWSHRQLGRVIGLVWALGFAGFALARRIPPGWSKRFWLLGLLGGAQGAIGWWMVSSGLGGEMVAVAPYRLAVHLGLGFAILGFIAWYALLLGRPEAQLLQARRLSEPKLFGMATGVLHLSFLQVLLGALVAGTRAGRGYTDWPWMGGQFLPPDPFSIAPLWRNFFENQALVQFDHRMIGYLVVIFGAVVALLGRRSAHAATRAAFGFMGAWLFLQVVLGIATLMHGAPLALGLAHQLAAVVAWVLILRARFLARYPLVQSIRGSK
ncbi:MAG: heme A synthase [Paenirhodobacter sp.]|uniref:heme A synthase n=1 Tax=Paenirhodobacter sp. TaxID=1965326 RepID=UPI003D14A3AA